MPFRAHAPRPGRPALPVTPLRRHIIDADELARLADALGGVGDLGPMAYLGTVDGLRWGEVAGLRIGHLDLEAQTLSVTETVVRGRRGTVGFGEPKSTAGRRTLAVPVELVAMLMRHIEVRGLLAGYSKGLLFTRPDGGVLRYSNWLRRAWWPACVAAGLGRMVEDEVSRKVRYEGLGFHDCGARTPPASWPTGSTSRRPKGSSVTPTRG